MWYSPHPTHKRSRAGLTASSLQCTGTFHSVDSPALVVPPLLFLRVLRLHWYQRSQREVMERRGDFASPGAARRPPFCLDESRDATPASPSQDELFSEDQIQEIEELLMRIGEAPEDADPSAGRTAFQSAAAVPVTPATLKNTDKSLKARRLHRYIETPASRQDAVWRSHIADVHTYLDGKRSETTRALLAERKFRKETRSPPPRRRTASRSEAPQTLSAETSAHPLFLRADDLERFVASRAD